MASGRILRALILGAPGSGKGTISNRLVEDFKLVHLASGDLLRQQISVGSDAGKEAKDFIVKGQLVPDPLMVSLISEELNKMKSSWLLDGFPRTVSQAESLSESQPINLVINLDVPFDTIRQRLEKRWIHAGSGRTYHTDWSPPKQPGLDDVTGEQLTQRDDDKPETVQNRLRLYDENTRPLIDYYRSRDVLFSFEGTESNIIYPKMKNFLEVYLQKFQ